MLSIENTQISDAILALANECNCRRNNGAAGEEHLLYVEKKLLKLREGVLARLDTPHPDTARLEWMLKRCEIFRDETPIPHTRADIDAAMHPAPKYRPWTPEEAIGRQIREIARPHNIYLIVLVSDRFAWTGPGTTGRTFETILRELVCHPDGSPCGVEVTPC